MNTAIVLPTQQLPSLIESAEKTAKLRFLEFFTVNIRNPNTRRAYGKAAAEFLAWCTGHGVTSLATIQPVHVASWIEEITRDCSVPTAKQRLAAIRHLFDWLVTGHVVPNNPAHAVRGPSQSMTKGKTPVLSPEEARRLIDGIDVSLPIGLRDRALIGLMVYSFARIGAALSMLVEDVFVQNRRMWVRLHEKGGKRHEMPCHHNLETWLGEYVDQTCINLNSKGPLFPTIRRGTQRLSEHQLSQPNAWAMVQRRAKAVGIATMLNNHSFRATGITTYLVNGGTLENAAMMANHASTRTTQLYDRRNDNLTLDEIERISI